MGGYSTDGASAGIMPANSINDIEIDWEDGTRTNQVDLDDVPNGTTALLGQNCSITGTPGFVGLTLSANSAVLTHTGTTDLAISSTSGIVTVENATFNGGLLSNLNALSMVLGDHTKIQFDATAPRDLATEVIDIDVAIDTTNPALDVPVITNVIVRAAADTGGTYGIQSTLTTGNMANNELSYLYGGTYNTSACTTTTSNAAVFYAGTSTVDAQCNDYGLLIESGYDYGIYTSSPIGGPTNIVLIPSTQTSLDVIAITPSATLNASQIWKGIDIDGGALDPNGVSTEIYGTYIDFSGVSLTNDPKLEGIRIYMPTTYSGEEDYCAFDATGNGDKRVEILGNFDNALQIDGELHHNYTAGADAVAHYTVQDLVIDGSLLDPTSEIHAFDVALNNGTSGSLYAVGTHPGVGVIHQHVGVFASPGANYAGRWTGGTYPTGSYADNIDGQNILVANNDGILIGSASTFDEIQIILGTAATKDAFSEFYYLNSGGTMVEFFPGDDTNGFTQDGIIRFNSDNFTSWWNIGDPGIGATDQGYWIYIKRTRVSSIGTVVLTTAKTVAPTTYFWNETGQVGVASLTVTQPVATSGVPNTVVITSGAHTGMTASTEVEGTCIDHSATKTWATGAITSQREVYIHAPTYAFAGGSTITNAATLYIDAAPTAGANATITNNHALWIGAGNSQFDGGLSY